MRDAKRAFTIRLGELLRQRREDADITQVEMARRLGVLQSFVSRYETGERKLDAFDLLRVCDELGVVLEDVRAH